MSRSNPSPTTPVRKFYSWGGASGALQWYDKEEGKRIDIKLPFSFIVLDELTTIGGFSDTNQSGIWSNEVRTVNDQLIVKTSAGTLATGTYQSLKNELKAQGAKYARSVYIAYQEPSGETFEWVIGNIKFVGAGLGAWFDFRKKVDVYEGGVRLTGSITDKKGANTFHVPTFERTDIEQMDADIAVELDRELQKYLESYFNQKRDDSIAAHDTSDDVVVEDLDDKPIDLSEIPF